MVIEPVMFSVDYPFSPNTKGRSFLDQAATILGEEDMRKLAHGNAERVLRLRPAAASAP